MAVSERISQFWLPSLLFILSLASILFTWHNDDLPVIGPDERHILSDKELDGLRQSFNSSLLSSGDWRLWCSDPLAAKEQLRFPHFQSVSPQQVLREPRRDWPQTVQDAVLRCHNSNSAEASRLLSCLHLTPLPGTRADGLFLLELSVELRSAGRKTLLTCQEALAGHQSIELDFFYSYYWTEPQSQGLLHFQHLTGGTRILPALAQASRPIKALPQP